jgi:hypothetical protein
VPQRHHSLFTQVSTYTQKGLKKLREDFEENQEKLFGTGENSDFLHKTTFQIVKDDENQMTAWIENVRGLGVGNSCHCELYNGGSYGSEL